MSEASPNQRGTAGGPELEELRIAPVMTGGTSLSVWMSGVTAELYNMLSAWEGSSSGSSPTPSTRDAADDAGDSDPQILNIYRQLLSLGKYKPRVDVITGTSAGGVNGVFLAAAWRYQVPAKTFTALRETWLKLADLEELLRATSETEPTSLLKGDDYFRTEIVKVLERWRGEGQPASTTDRPIDLLLTVTTVKPEPRHRSDDFNETLSDVNHAHRLRFTAEHITDRRAVEAEEPNGEGEKGSRGNETYSEWPMKLSIAARTSASIPGVFEPSYLPVTAEDSKTSGLPNLADHASFTKSRFAVDGGVVVNLPLREALERVFFMPASVPVRRVVMFIQPTPTLKNVGPDSVEDPPTLIETISTVITGPRAEAVTEEVDRIQQHNRSVRRQAQARRAILKELESETLVESAEKLMADYRQARAEESVRKTTSYIARALETSELEKREVESALEQARKELVPRSVKSRSVDAQEAPSWAWGIAPVEHAASMVGGLLQSAPRELDDKASSRQRLDGELAKVQRLREEDRRYWTARLDELRGMTGVQEKASPERIEILERWAEESYRGWPGLERREAAFEELKGAFDGVVAILRDLSPELRSEVNEDWERWAELEALAPLNSSRVKGSATEIGNRLLALHVMQQVILGDVVSREQEVELQQVSWNAANYLDPNRAPEEKLAGTELGRLGAFVKRSWRANDFFWGRMDGASALAHLLLEPKRLREVDLRRERLREVFSEIGLPDEEVAVAVDEICPNDHPTTGRAPDSIPRTVSNVGRRLQTLIAEDELPEVSEAITHSRLREGANDLNGAEFLKEYESERKKNGVKGFETVSSLVKKLRVGEEDVGSEFGYGLLNRTFSRIAAVVVNMLSGSRTGIPVVPKVLRPLRTPVHATNAVVRTAADGTPLGKFLVALVFAVGGALIGLRITGQPISGVLLATAELLILGALIAALFRTRFYWHAFWAIPIGLVVLLATVGGGLADFFYDQGHREDLGALDAGSVINLGDDGLVRVTSLVEGDEIVSDIQLPGGKIEIRSPGSNLESAESAGPQDWKTWVFLDDWAAVRWALFVVALLSGGVLVSRRQWNAGRVLAGVVSALALIAGLQWSFLQDLLGDIMTGSSSEAPTWKTWLVGVAEGLSAVEVEVVVFALVVAALIIGTGTDLWFRQGWRKLARWWSRSWSRVEAWFTARSIWPFTEGDT